MHWLVTISSWTRDNYEQNVKLFLKHEAEHHAAWKLIHIWNSNNSLNENLYKKAKKMLNVLKTSLQITRVGDIWHI